MYHGDTNRTERATKDSPDHRGVGMRFDFPSEGNTDKMTISGQFYVDKDGNPAGGYAEIQTERRGWTLQFQNGPLDREAGDVPNGVFVEDLLKIVQLRLEFYQNSKFRCSENAEAVCFVTEAIRVLQERRSDRQKRGVEGKHEE